MDAAMVERTGTGGLAGLPYSGTPVNDMVDFWQGENSLFFFRRIFFFFSSLVIQKYSGNGGNWGQLSDNKENEQTGFRVWPLYFDEKKGSFTELQPTKSRGKRS